MKFTKIVILLSALTSGLLAVSNADAELIPNPDGVTVHDSVLQVNWLMNANLALTPDLGYVTKFSAYCRALSLTTSCIIAPNGSMDYPTAVLWVKYLNDNNYMWRHDWTMPLTPMKDATCSVPKGGPHHNSFGFGCRMSEMGSLFYSEQSLNFEHPNTAVPIQTPNQTVGPFTNFQPYLYWSNTSKGGQGFKTFSFNTGWTGANVNSHYMYVLPMIPGNAFRIKPNGNGLQLSADGKTVYDPIEDVTWLADANFAMTQTFSVQGINPDGSMKHEMAEDWIEGMNNYNYPNCPSGKVGWLCRSDWQLPPIPLVDPSCNPISDNPKNTQPNFGFGCTGNPMGGLFYKQLLLSQGSQKIATPPASNVGPFYNVQPYLYWSSCQQPPSPSHCAAEEVDSNGVKTWVPALNFEWSFSFGNGFQGTDVAGNNLDEVGNNFYVMVYYPDNPGRASDTTPPVTTATFSGTLGLNGWYVGQTVVNFAATDDLSGVFKTEFSLDDGTSWTTTTSNLIGSYFYPPDGNYTILFRSTDFSGNVEAPKSINVKVDSTAPFTGVNTHYNKLKNGVPINFEVDFIASDNASGVAKTQYSLDNGSTWRTGTATFFATSGVYTILYHSIDVAGNVERRHSITVTVSIFSGGP